MVSDRAARIALVFCWQAVKAATAETAASPPNTLYLATEVRRHRAGLAN